MAKKTAIVAVMIVFVIAIVSGCATINPVKDAQTVDQKLQKYVGCTLVVSANPYQCVIFMDFYKDGKIVARLVRAMSVGIPLELYELVDGKMVVTWRNPYWSEYLDMLKKKQEEQKKNGKN